MATRCYNSQEWSTEHGPRIAVAYEHTEAEAKDSIETYNKVSRYTHFAERTGITWGVFRVEVTLSFPMD